MKKIDQKSRKNIVEKSGKKFPITSKILSKINNNRQKFDRKLTKIG